MLRDAQARDLQNTVINFIRFTHKLPPREVEIGHKVFLDGKIMWSYEARQNAKTFMYGFASAFQDGVVTDDEKAPIEEFWREKMSTDVGLTGFWAKVAEFSPEMPDEVQEAIVNLPEDIQSRSPEYAAFNQLSSVLKFVSDGEWYPLNFERAGWALHAVITSETIGHSSANLQQQKIIFFAFDTETGEMRQSDELDYYHEPEKVLEFLNPLLS